MARRRIAVRAVAFTAAVAAAAWVAYRVYASRSVASETDRLAHALQLQPGSRVADVGAGGGAYARELAARIVTDGRVFATEIDESSIERLAEQARRAGLSNLTAVQAAADATNLSPGCCDAAFLRGVYHHVTHPAETMASLHEALRPSARLAIVDFEPSWFLSTFFRVDDVPANRGGHGIPPDVVVEEVERAGFRLIERIDGWTSGQYCLVFERS
jgi:ubiquinone/menaquinone biosynthesis C-methylase UbiE